jgi:transposase
MNASDRQKEIEKEKSRLEVTMIRQKPSKAWLDLNRKVKQIHYKIANQRKDVLHKVSRLLVEGCDLVGVGHWEPPREVSYRKKLRALKKMVKRGRKGAKKELEALVAEKSKQGPKGSRKRRRGGRDRSIATLRRLLEEKAQRSGTQVFTYVNEAGSTMTCNVCALETGPKNDLKIREWRCKSCNTVHNRDINSAFNILLKAENQLAAAQAAASATKQTVTRTMTQGAMVQPESNLGFHATESCGRGDPNISQQSNNLLVPLLWGGKVPKAFNSLKQMGIISTIQLENKPEIVVQPP